MRPGKISDQSNNKKRPWHYQEMAGEKRQQVAAVEIPIGNPSEPQSDELADGLGADPSLIHVGQISSNWEPPFQVGDLVDVRDSIGYWCEAEVR